MNVTRGSLKQGFRTVWASTMILAASTSASWAEAPIKIGVLLPMSGGPYVQPGADVFDGLDLAFQEAGNVVVGRKIVLLREDTAHKPDVAQSKAKKLVFEDKVDFIIGPISAPELTGLVPFANQSKTPLIIPNAGDDSVTGARCTEWVLRTSFSNGQVVRNMGSWMIGQNYKRVSLIASDYLAGHEISEDFKKPFIAAGGQILSEQYPPFGPTSDFGPYLSKIKDDKPDAVFAFLPGSPSVAFVKQYADFGLKQTTPLAGGWLVSPQVLPAQGDAADGVLGIVDYVPSIDSPVNRAFKTAFESKYGRSVSEYASHGFDTGKLITAAIQLLDGKTTDKRAFVDALHKVKIDGTRGNIRIDPKTNNIIQDMYVFRVEKQDGRMEFKILKRFPDVQDPPDGCVLPR